jgi:hypothetical protein
LKGKDQLSSYKGYQEGQKTTIQKRLSNEIVLMDVIIMLNVCFEIEEMEVKSR